ncbi:unnamed protein product [Arctogadus glacialis]
MFSPRPRPVEVDAKRLASLCFTAGRLGVSRTARGAWQAALSSVHWSELWSHSQPLTNQNTRAMREVLVGGHWSHSPFSDSPGADLSLNGQQESQESSKSRMKDELRVAENKEEEGSIEVFLGGYSTLGGETEPPGAERLTVNQGAGVLDKAGLRPEHREPTTSPLLFSHGGFGARIRFPELFPSSVENSCARLLRVSDIISNGGPLGCCGKEGPQETRPYHHEPYRHEVQQPYHHEPYHHEVQQPYHHEPYNHEVQQPYHQEPYHHEVQPYHHEPYNHEVQQPYHHEVQPYHHEPYHHEVQQPYHHEPYNHEVQQPYHHEVQPYHHEPYHHEVQPYHHEPYLHESGRVGGTPGTAPSPLAQRKQILYLEIFSQVRASRSQERPVGPVYMFPSSP